MYEDATSQDLKMHSFLKGKDWFSIVGGHLFRLVRDYRNGRRVNPIDDDVPETAWLHSCEADKCGKYSHEETSG